MGDFIDGRSLSRAFYHEAVQPILRTHFSSLQFSAALIGTGSEVLGYDDLQSTDHGWGPRLTLFVRDAEHDQYATAISAALSAGLPSEFNGYATSFDHQLRDPTASHVIGVVPISRWFNDLLGFDPADGVTIDDWLATPSQLLLEATTGEVYHDGQNVLAERRAALEWYPHDVWLYLISCQWQRISQEESFPGRCAQVGDDLGSRLVTARLVRDVMRLCFLLEKRYTPYTKWFGRAFQDLDCAADVGPLLDATLGAKSWDAREEALCALCSKAGELHNRAGLTEHVDPTMRRYHNRPFMVIGAGRFCAAAMARISSPQLKKRDLSGSIDQFADSTEVLSSPARAREIFATFAS